MWKECLKVFICFGKGLRLRSCVVTHLGSFVIPDALKTAILKVQFSEFPSFIYAESSLGKVLPKQTYWVSV